MTGKFDKWTPNARMALEHAQSEARRLNHNYVGTEHLLLGILSNETGEVARTLDSFGITAQKARGAVEFIIGRGSRPVIGDLGLTPRAKMCIELAVDEAQRQGSEFIGAGHILIGLVREGEGIAAGVMKSLGVDPQKLRQAFWPPWSEQVTDEDGCRLELRSLSKDGNAVGLYLNDNLQMVMKTTAARDLGNLINAFLGKNE